MTGCKVCFGMCNLDFRYASIGYKVEVSNIL